MYVVMVVRIVCYWVRLTVLGLGLHGEEAKAWSKSYWVRIRIRVMAKMKMYEFT